MEENNCKLNNWKRINLQSIQTAHAAQYQKKKQPNLRMSTPKKHFSKEDILMTNTWKDAQHSSLLYVLVSQSYPTLCNAKGCSPLRLLCPWDFPGKNTGVDSHSLLQEIFLPPLISYVANRLFTIWATREAQGSSLLGKCKSKLQWVITSHQSEWPS